MPDIEVLLAELLASKRPTVEKKQEILDAILEEDTLSCKEIQQMVNDIFQSAFAQLKNLDQHYVA